MTSAPPDAPVVDVLPVAALLPVDAPVDAVVDAVAAGPAGPVADIDVTVLAENPPGAGDSATKTPAAGAPDRLTVRFAAPPAGVVTVSAVPA